VIKISLKKKDYQKTTGFALPTILIVSIVMLTVLFAAVTSTAAVRSSLDSQYYDKISQTAGEAGLVVANVCLKANSGVVTWSVGKPLKSNTNCAGIEFIPCSNSSLDDECGVLIGSDNLVTNFTVPAPDNIKNLSSSGSTKLLRTSNSSVWREYTQSSKLAIIISNIPTDWLTIGTQTWAKANLNVGNMITGATTQTNNGVLKKYCYNDTEANCTTYGGLYQWGEAVQYLNGASNTTSPSPAFSGNVQGICPTGSHIPSDNDWKILEVQLGMTQAQADAIGSSRGTNQGTQLKSGGTSGLNVPLGGERYGDGDFFVGWPSVGYLWSSSEWSTNPSVAVLVRYMISDDGFVVRAPLNKDEGLPVRCLKN